MCQQTVVKVAQHIAIWLAEICSHTQSGPSFRSVTVTVAYIDWKPFSFAAGFANEGQFLLMNSASLEDLYQRMALQAKQAEHAEQARQPHNGHHTAQSAAALSRFRPNLLVGGQNMAAYAEDDWQEVQIGGTHMFHSTGKQHSGHLLNFNITVEPVAASCS